jgi:hypothetical protein
METKNDQNIELEDGKNWFLNISDTKLTKKNIKTPLYLTESFEYLGYMTREGKYEDSKGYNKFYISQIEIDPKSWIFGLNNNPGKDDLENLQDYLSHIRQLKFQSHGAWGKQYTKKEIIELLCKHKMWYITEAIFMKPFYKYYGYDGFITEEYAGYEDTFKNICLLNKEKILTVEDIPVTKDLRKQLLREETKKKKYAFLRVDEDGIGIRLSDNLDDFKKFNHYGFEPEQEHIDDMKEEGIASWTGNDTWYYIIQHNSWDYMDLNPKIIVEKSKLEESEKKSFARILAQIAHDDEGQRRRKTKEPYWKHTQSVADIVESYGGNEDQIIAAEFHDTLEDTKLPIELLEDNFGIKVRDLVLELTNDEKSIEHSGKELYMNDKLINLSDEALLIKLADFYSNLTGQPGPKQLERMKNNIKYLVKNRDVKGKNKELLSSIIEYIRGSSK